MAFQALEVPHTLIAGRTSNANEVGKPLIIGEARFTYASASKASFCCLQAALLTRAGSLGRTLDSYVASVSAYWDSQGPRVVVRVRVPLSCQVMTHASCTWR